MSIFSAIICFLFFYSISIVQIPIGIIGGTIFWLKFLIQKDEKKARWLKYVSKVFFISAIPLVGPCMAFNYQPKEEIK